jgi:hypothetical protein
MKKLLITSSVLLMSFILRSNPLPGPTVVLSELKFENGDNWVIELQYFVSKDQIDTIWIRSSAGISKIKNLNKAGLSDIIVITKDSLVSDLSISPTNDSLEISYSDNSYTVVKDWITYGNFLNAQLSSPKTGQSIALVPGSDGFNSEYSIDKSPTIGEENDSIGMCGLLTGHIYDKDNNLITTPGIYLKGPDYPIQINSDGTYSTKMLSRNRKISNLLEATNLFWQVLSLDEWNTINIAPIEVSMEPDSVVSVDIHLLDKLVVGVNEVSKTPESIMKISPNPINSLTFNYEIDIPVQSSVSSLELYGMNGQLVAIYPIIEKTGKINLPADIKNGNYTVVLSVNNKKYCAAKVIIAK